jgi:glutaredoxin
MKLQRLGLAALVGLATTLPAHALYKVVGPDGKITYTDVPPPQVVGKVAPLAKAAAAPEVPLPADLKQSMTRYPVTLYTAPDCLPCDEARRLLRSRGVPHKEKTVKSEADREAWSRIVGGPEAPSLMIGGQSLRGLETLRWQEYLDAAGYPRTSKLPSGYQFAEAEPLVQPKPPEEARAKPPAPAAAPAGADDSLSDAPRFRF